jgi:hypothetical protein
MEAIEPKHNIILLEILTTNPPYSEYILIKINEKNTPKTTTTKR